MASVLVPVLMRSWKGKVIENVSLLNASVNSNRIVDDQNKAESASNYNKIRQIFYSSVENLFSEGKRLIGQSDFEINI